MNFLAPWGLLLAAAVAVPLALHLLRRRTGTRVEFPAVRYLLRAEKEHAREVRLRNLLLMLLRVGIVVALALAIARPIGPFPGTGHPPTAVAIVVDNSLSSSSAGPEGPALARLVVAARAVVAAASAGDALSLVTMDGEVVGGAPAELDNVLTRLTSLDGAGDPAQALRRARALLAASPLPERRLVVVTDGQATTWRAVGPDASVPVPTSLLALPPRHGGNRSVRTVTLDPPHWSPRGTVRVTLGGADSASWRVTLGGRSVARGTATRGAPIAPRIEATGRGWMAGTVELAPDELRGDDVRHFAVHVGEAPAVAVAADAGVFVRGAVAALVDAGRLRRGAGLFIGPAPAATRPGLIFAPTDPLDIADANRALTRAGIPWRFGARRTGPSPLRGEGLADVSAAAWYDLTPSAGASADTLARVGAAPWVVAGDGYVLVASAPDAEATTLPTRAAFVPWLDQLIAQRLSSANGVAREVAPGAMAVVPAGVDALEAPDGSARPVQPRATIAAPMTAGVHFWLRGDARAGALVVNPEAAESDLTALDADSLARALGAPQVAVDAPRLARETFRAAGRRALDSGLLGLALVLLIVEALVARRRAAAVAASAA